jgi:glyoxylase-like metal-dependent hydrolase (beta-lactamase superfamily II)/rhodanese-related sulfurtransferase
MNIIPFIHEGLGNSSYLVGLDGGNAILVDPDRTVQRYLDAADARGWRIATVLETHLHADFVSGAHELASAVGAKLFVPEDEGLRLPHQGIRGSERWVLDGVEIESIASPGHTPEHMSYVIRAGSHPPALFSGGSLMVGGAARTDLISPDMTDELTRAQYRTLRVAFSTLPDETGLYPTHGGGSFCSSGGTGGTGGSRTSTLGAERSSNPLLAFSSEDEFADWFPTTLPSAPDYYFRMRAFNQAGPRLRRDIQPPPSLTPTEFNDRRRDAVVIDARPIGAYAKAHVSGSISIEFRDAFAVWLGWLVPADARLLFVAGDAPVEQLIDESLLVGYERFAGVLDGGVHAWEDAGLPVARSGLITAGEARRVLLDGATVLDVRELGEYASGHIPDARHVPLGELAGRVDELPLDRPVVAYCGHGERSATALSLLERSGRTALLNLDGGIDVWRDAGYPIAS